MPRKNPSAPNPLMGPPLPRKNRWQVRTLEDAAVFLAKKARNAAKAAGNPHLLTIGAVSTLSRWVREDLVARGMTADRVDWESLSAGKSPPKTAYAAVICTDTDIRGTAGAARAVTAHPQLREIPFEAVTLTDADYAVLRRHDRLKAADLVSPVPLIEPDFAGIYEASLAHFEKKCDARDYMDLCQAVHQVAAGGVPGDAAEFGSFRGHSGYLLARLLEKRHPLRRLFLFDMFDAFPEETMGIDRFWSGSHPVSFKDVRERFKPFPFVTLVKGDFTRTLDGMDIGRLALVHVDCDSYRATDYLIRRLYPEVLSPGGVMVFEDYGHPQLLGSRAAVHGFFDGREDAVCFFSHFSGCYLVFKR